MKSNTRKTCNVENKYLRYIYLVSHMSVVDLSLHYYHCFKNMIVFVLTNLGFYLKKSSSQN